MHSYPEFPNDAIEIFTPLMKKYDLTIEESSVYHIIFGNKNTQLSFEMDQFKLSGIIVEKNSRPRRRFAVHEVIDYLYPEYNNSEDIKSYKHYDEGREGIIKTLNGYAYNIETYLYLALLGDFHWSKKLFAKVYPHQIKVIDLIYKNFDKDHEIIRLYEDDDGSWESKLYEYLGFR